VPAGLIAEFADIDLKNGDPCRVKRKQTRLAKSRLERRTRPRFGETPELFGRGSERIIALQ
jgi:hypothetical protein